MSKQSQSPARAVLQFLAANKIWWIGPILLVIAAIAMVILLGSLGAGIPPMYK